jgi:transcriptional regulator with XRE-family HTH domain
MTSEFNQKLGKKIQSIRRKFTNLNQEQMAELLGKDPRCYRKYESGETAITTERLNQIAKIFNMESEDILNYTEDRFVQNNTFHNQKGNGVLVQPSMTDSEKEIYGRWIAEKNDQLKIKDEQLTRKDEIIDGLRQENRQQHDELLFLKEQLKLKTIKV